MQKEKSISVNAESEFDWCEALQRVALFPLRIEVTAKGEKWLTEECWHSWKGEIKVATRGWNDARTSDIQPMRLVATR